MASLYKYPLNKATRCLFPIISLDFFTSVMEIRTRDISVFFPHLRTQRHSIRVHKREKRLVCPSVRGLEFPSVFGS